MPCKNLEHIIARSCCVFYECQSIAFGQVPAVFSNKLIFQVMTVMMGGVWYDKFFGDSTTKQDILRVALEQLKDILQLDERPISHHVSILKDCISQYTVGHEDRVQSIQSYIKSNNLPLHLCGSSYHGVGVNDVIFSGKKTVGSI